MADPMRIRAQVSGTNSTVRVLMSHEMESGQRKDASGKTVPAWFIQEVTATHNGKTVFECLATSLHNDAPWCLTRENGLAALIAPPLMTAIWRWSWRLFHSGFEPAWG